jgi:ABC-type sugar transport system substrate-binding protein
MSQLAAQAGRTEIGFIGFQGAPEYVQSIAAGDPPGAAATVSIPLPFMGYAALDLAARVLAGLETWEADDLPIGIIDASNADDFDPAEPFLAPEEDFREAFMELWGRN